MDKHDKGVHQVEIKGRLNDSYLDNEGRIRSDKLKTIIQVTLNKLTNLLGIRFSLNVTSVDGSGLPTIEILPDSENSNQLSVSISETHFVESESEEAHATIEWRGEKHIVPYEINKRKHRKKTAIF